MTHRARAAPARPATGDVRKKSQNGDFFSVQDAEPAASAELEQLARLAATLRPDWRGDIWLYYQTRSDLIARLRRAARRAAAMERQLK